MGTGEAISEGRRISREQGRSGEASKRCNLFRNWQYKSRNNTVAVSTRRSSNLVLSRGQKAAEKSTNFEFAGRLLRHSRENGFWIAGRISATTIDAQQSGSSVDMAGNSKVEGRTGIGR